MPGLGYLTTPGSPGTPGDSFVLTNAPDGAWTWFGEPRAIHVSGWTYFGYVDTSGNVCVRTYEHASETVGSEIVLHAALDADDHVNPTLIVRPDGKLQTFYSRHEPISTDLHTRVSVNTIASDPDLSGGFASEVNLDSQLVATSYDYASPFMLGATMYLFWRSIPGGNNYNLVYSTSADGDTWSSAVPLYHNTTKTNRAYWKITGDGSRIDFAVTDGSPNTDTTHLAHFYYDGTWRNSGGTSLGALPGGGFAFSAFTAVHTSSNSWVYDIGYVGGDPVILYATYPTPFSSHQYNYAAWDGAAWQKNDICLAGGGIDSTGVYSGGFALDRNDAQIVYASREVSAEYEMYRYTTADGGVNWSEDAITSGSSSKNIRPTSVLDAAAELAVIWMVGTYSGYTSFNTGIKGSP
jgi:hypothetical protein